MNSSVSIGKLFNLFAPNFFSSITKSSNNPTEWLTGSHNRTIEKHLVPGTWREYNKVCDHDFTVTNFMCDLFCKSLTLSGPQFPPPTRLVGVPSSKIPTECEHGWSSSAQGLFNLVIFPHVQTASTTTFLVFRTKETPPKDTLTDEEIDLRINHLCEKIPDLQ